MSEYDNTNRFSLWPNREKREGKQDADFTGTINVDGKEYWINGWKKKADANPKAPSLSGTIRAKDEAHQEGMAQAQAAVQDDDIPF
jgi:hypothetical protein